jgi:photosystem II stability/assembly factor-like uncharacterized protein
MKKLLYILIVNCSLLITHCYTQWVQQSVPVTKPITGIKFINANTGWACTSIGMGGQNYAYILHTTNGGTNWFIQDSSFNTNYRAISVIGTNIIYAGGDTLGNGKLSKSTNGGLNWQYIGTPSAIDDMYFLNQDSGYYCADFIGADVRTTTDGGATWQVRINGIAAQTQRIFFLNYNTGFCGANFNLYKTTNAGQNWVLNGNFTDGVNAVYFINNNTGWIGLAQNKVVYTSNAGTNWIYQVLPPNSSFTITDVYFYDTLKGWAGNRNIRIMKTVDGGLNWGYQLNSTTSYRLSFIDSSKGWIGDVGISKTTNGGGTIFYTGINIITTEVPNSYILHQNYPNPFNPTTKINFDIKAKSFVRLVIFDVLGKIVKELVNEKLNAGKYEYVFEAADIPSGIYFYKLITEEFSATRKMILIK